jgi:hypothetical protein
MADPSHTQPTLFARLEQIRATVEGARADVRQLRDSIRCPKSVNGDRTSAEDIRIQLRQALARFDDLLYELTPLKDFHIDQQLDAPLEVTHGNA